MDIGIVPGEIGILPEYREVTGTPRGVIGPTWASRDKREGGRRGPRAPPLPSPNRTREGGGAPPPFLPLFLLFPPFSYSYLERGSPTPSGSRTPPRGAPSRPAASSPLAPLYTGAGGTPKTHKLIYGSFLSRVRCPLPPYSTSVISSRSLGEALCR